MSNSNDTDRVENPRLKNYLYRAVQRDFKRNPLFAQIYGKNFIKSIIKDSVKKVYSNETPSAKGSLAYHSADDSITFCFSSSDGSLLKPDDFILNPNNRETMLHETVHAVLTRTPDELVQYGISYGTGLLEQRFNFQTGRHYEIGRGLNEGFTEWICERIGGYPARAYREQTNYIKLLELAVGTEKILELGKGNVLTRGPLLLGIPSEDFQSLIASTDVLYEMDSQLLTSRILRGLLAERQNGLENVSEENIKKFEASKPELEQVRNDPEFLAYIQKNGLDNSDASILKYLDDYKLKDLVDRKQSSMAVFESRALKLYFAKDMQQIFAKEGPISKEDYENVSKIMNLLCTFDPEYLPDYIRESQPELTVITIKKEYSVFKERYLKQLAQEQAKKYKAGEISLGDIAQFGTQIDLPLNKSQDIIREAVMEIDPDFAESLMHIIDSASRDIREGSSTYQRLEGTRMFKLVSQDETRECESTLLFSEGNFADNYLGPGKSVGRDAQDVTFDFTEVELENGQYEYSVAIQNFLALRRKVLAENPNNNIYISGRNVIVQDTTGNTSFYTIDKGEMVPMSIVKQAEVSVIPKQRPQQINPNQETSLVPAKQGRFSNFINSIRRKIYEARTGKQSPQDLSKPATTAVPGKLELIPGKKEEKEETEETVIDSYRVEDFDERLKASQETQSLETAEQQRDETVQENDDVNR